MNFYRLLTLNVFYFSSLLAVGYVGDTAKISDGIIYAKGEFYNRQVFLEKKDTIIQLTNFGGWEEIHGLYASKDQKILLIYHKTNKQKGRKLSTLDLNSYEITNTIQPGFGGSLQWTINNNILQIWGCGSPCACFRIYNQNLKSLIEECGTGYDIFIENDLIVSLPVMTIQMDFEIYSLSSGKLIKKIDFKDKYRNYNSWETKIVDNQLEVELNLYDSDQTVKEYIDLNH